MIGLKNNEVYLSDFDENWENIAKEKIDFLKNILKDVAIDIVHIGSTSVKGIKAKPIIDIQVGLKHLDDVIKYKDELEKSGFYFKESSRPNEEVLFIEENKNGETFILVHFVIFKSEVWNQTILFKEYLNKYEDLKKIYQDKKEDLALKYKNDRKKYTAYKIDVIRQILEIGKNRENEIN